jgi:hypothetical protein
MTLFRSLWSFLEMLPFDARHFVAALNSLIILESFLPQEGNLEDESALPVLEKQLSSLSTIVLTAGMPSTADAINRLRQSLKLGRLAADIIRDDIKDIRRRLQDDLKRTYFFSVTKHLAKLVPLEPLFGEKVNDNFLTAAPDIEEAGKCLALDRGTACVFHLMRVLEVGLRALAATLSVTITSDNWNTILEAIEKEIRSRRSKGPTPDWSPEDELFFTEVTTSFYLFKNAWRNYSLHKPVMYPPEKAEEIYTAVRSFMKHIAQRIAEPR